MTELSSCHKTNPRVGGDVVEPSSLHAHAALAKLSENTWVVHECIMALMSVGLLQTSENHLLIILFIHVCLLFDTNVMCFLDLTQIKGFQGILTGSVQSHLQYNTVISTRTEEKLQSD